jgi:hypothetical protein
LRVRHQFENFNARASVLFNRKCSARHTLRTGLIYSRLGYDVFAEGRDNDQHTLQQYTDQAGSTSLWQAYGQWKYRLAEHWTLNALTMTLNHSTSVEPRLGLKWAFSPSQALSTGFGMHSRHESMIVCIAGRTNAENGDHGRPDPGAQLPGGVLID